MNNPHEDTLQRRQPEHFKLRIDAPLRKWIKIHAAQNSRSMTGEIIHALNVYRQHVDNQEHQAARPSA